MLTSWSCSYCLLLFIIASKVGAFEILILICNYRCSSTQTSRYKGCSAIVPGPWYSQRVHWAFKGTSEVHIIVFVIHKEVPYFFPLVSLNIMIKPKLTWTQRKHHLVKIIYNGNKEYWSLFWSLFYGIFSKPLTTRCNQCMLVVSLKCAC